MGSNIATELKTVVRNRRQFDGNKFIDWLEDNISQPGPWNTHECTKHKINSFLKHRLAMQGSDTLEVRRYLDPSDEDDIWCLSVCDKVIPFLEEEINT